MNENVLMKYNVKRVNRFNVILIWTLSILLTGQAFLTSGASYGLKVLLCTLTASIIASIALFFNLTINKYENVTALIIAFSIAIAAGYLSHMQKGSNVVTIFLVYMGSVAMIAMYFRVKLLITYAVLLNMFLAIFYFLDPIGLMGETYSTINFIRVLFSMDFILIIFYFLTKWGNEYIITAYEKEKDANELLSKLRETMEKIDNNTSVLNDGIGKSFKYLQNLEGMSNQNNNAVEDIAKGIAENAISTAKILQQTNVATNIIEKTKILSNEVRQHSDNMKNIVFHNSQEIDSMVLQMNTIDIAVGTALTNVSELQSNM